MTKPLHLRPATPERVRAFWDDFLRTWGRIGIVHWTLVSAPTDTERWRRVWMFDDRGRIVTHPWGDPR